MSGKCLALGQKLVVVTALDFGDYGQVIVGDTCTVTYHNEATGETQLSVHRLISEMCAWENAFTITDDESCDDMRASLRHAEEAGPASVINFIEVINGNRYSSRISDSRRVGDCL